MHRFDEGIGGCVARAALVGLALASVAGGPDAYAASVYSDNDPQKVPAAGAARHTHRWSGFLQKLHHSTKPKAAKPQPLHYLNSEWSPE